MHPQHNKKNLNLKTQKMIPLSYTIIERNHSERQVKVPVTFSNNNDNINNNTYESFQLQDQKTPDISKLH
jgi:hypothetical protein